MAPARPAWAAPPLRVASSLPARALALWALPRAQCTIPPAAATAPTATRRTLPARAALVSMCLICPTGLILLFASAAPGQSNGSPEDPSFWRIRSASEKHCLFTLQRALSTSTRRTESACPALGALRLRAAVLPPVSAVMPALAMTRPAAMTPRPAAVGITAVCSGCGCQSLSLVRTRPGCYAETEYLVSLSLQAAAAATRRTMTTCAHVSRSQQLRQAAPAAPQTCPLSAVADRPSLHAPSCSLHRGLLQVHWWQVRGLRGRRRLRWR